MHEGRQIVEAARSLAPGDGALATVLELRGSGYRRAGARMLAAHDGRLVGGISGGCLESDALEHAREVMRLGEPRLVTYDTTDPDDVLLGVGLGCQGVLRVWIEPLATPGCRAFLDAWDHVLGGRGELSQSLFPERRERALWLNGERVYADAGLLHLEEPVEAGLLDMAFHERLAPPPALWLVGAGLDAPAMARLAVAQGYRVSVIDHRPAYLRPERFPAGVGLHTVRPGFLPEALAHEQPAAVLLMTHHYEADRGWLGTMLPLAPRYLGLLGPRRRTEGLLAELGAAWPACLHAPMGLDIGAETPDEIALATLAEVRAVLAGRPGGFLRDRRAPIHGQPRGVTP